MGGYAEHSDAIFGVLTGDIAHWGDAADYACFAREITKLTMPAHLVVGNNDDATSLMQSFPDDARDEDGFVQSATETPFGRFLLLDTRAQGNHKGAFCAAR